MFATLTKRHSTARAELERGLRSDRYKDLLELLVSAAAAPGFKDAAFEPAADVLPSLVARSWKKLAKKGRALTPEASDEAFHKVRISSKRVRYAAEAVGPSLGGESGSAATFAERAADVQDVLGAHQDAVVGQEVFLAFAREHPDNGPINLAMGRLIEREAQEARETRDRFFKVWKKLDRKKNRRWLVA